ncbi:MAG: hypothetical protein JWM16_3013, partial [Verrucomicrobiales bacterium]|nr:hypothetical protein [Verrucomicrobiales bacterium]
MQRLGSAEDFLRADQSLVTGVLPKCQIAEKFLKCPSRVFGTEVLHMMSIHKPRPESRCYQVNLETRVREDNPLRLVNQVLDLS